MNIVLHIPALQSGGAERQLTYLAKGLADKMEEVHVVTFYSGGVFWDELSKDTRINLYSLDRKGKWDFYIVCKFVEYCKNNDIHLIQAFLAPSSVIASLSVTVLNIPLLIGIRSSDMKFQLGGRIYKYAERILGNALAKLYVCNSNAGLKYNSSIGYKKSIMKFIANGLNGPVTELKLPFQRSETIRLCMIGRLWPVKGIPTMLHAFSLLSERVEHIELWVYGEGDAAYKQKLLDMCSELNIENSVFWKGWISSTWCALDEIDILVSSSYSEGMSNTLMEGLAAQRIVVSTDVGDARILLDSEYGRSGYLVPHSNARLLSDVLDYAINNPEESLKYAERGRVQMEQQYSIEVMVDAYDKLYKEIIN